MSQLRVYVKQENGFNIISNTTGSITLKRGKTSVQLQGGLGNHIFQYAAAKYLASLKNSTLEIDKIRIGKGMAAQYGFLLDQIFNDFEIKKVNQNKYLNAIFEKLFVFKGRVVSMASQRSAILQKFTIRFLKIYHSNEVGYDSKLETLPSTISLNGYFQSWKYADYLIRKNSFEMSSNNLSNWYFKMKKDAEIVKPVVLHVRRGDYKLVADKFGLLSKEYYLNALSFLPGHLKKREIWVFSNEIHLAKAMLSENGQYNFKFIESEKSSTPVEALLLMLQGHAHIIANSTFSYWGAYLSQNSEVIIAPTKWFQNMNDPKDLLPPNWLRVQSVWEN